MFDLFETATDGPAKQALEAEFQRRGWLAGRRIKTADGGTQWFDIRVDFCRIHGGSTAARWEDIPEDVALLTMQRIRAANERAAAIKAQR